MPCAKYAYPSAAGRRLLARVIDEVGQLLGIGAREIQDVRIWVDDLREFVRAGRDQHVGPYSRLKSFSGMMAKSQRMEEPTGRHRL